MEHVYKQQHEKLNLFYDLILVFSNNFLEQAEPKIEKIFFSGNLFFNSLLNLIQTWFTYFKQN